MLDYFPKFFTQKAILIYIGILIFVSIVFRAMPALQLIFGVLEVMGFFYFSNRITMRWANLSERQFKRFLFQLSLVLRVLWVFISYFIYESYTGTPFDFSAADALGYHNEAVWVSELISKDNLASYFRYIGGHYSDMGYPFYLGILYFITDDSIIFARLLKALFGAGTVLITYKLGSRHFGVEVARMGAIFLMLFPNHIFYTGYHLKEVEMIFLAMLFLERSDDLLRSVQYSFLKISIIFTIVGSLFFLRTVLGATALFALLTTIFLSTKRASKAGQRWFLAIWVVIAMSYFLGGTIATEVEEIWEMRSSSQEKSLEFRAERVGGNKFATYASASIFAPAILVIPFPTMVNIESQPNQMMMNGGYFVKNFMAFFVLFAVFLIIKSKKWRENLLLSSFMIGYLIVVALSAFAQSERFHLPAMPVFLMFAAYGLNKFTEKEVRWYNYYLIFIVLAIVAWSWFKLAGRGII
jgi:4-amino-4-deoxy-L-arabinose transferase-like glycosyltransferase